MNSPKTSLIYVKEETIKQIDELQSILRRKAGFEMANTSKSAIVREAVRRFYLTIKKGGKDGD